MKKQILLFVGILSGFAATAIDLTKAWTFTSDKEVAVPGERQLYPVTYQLSKLNTAEFKQFQLSIPNEESGQFLSMSLPTPDGNLMNFKVFECPMMEKPLADKYNQIKTYTAISTENPLITAKLDFTVFGFHAKVFNGSQTYFIDPYTNLNSDWYIVYYKNQYTKSINQRMSCQVDEGNELLPPSQSVAIDGTTIPQNSYKQNGVNKRTYRLALACTLEYSSAVGGATPTKASVLSAMVTTMNRVNGVFEREFSMHANLVANNDTLIFLPPGTDPYTNNNGSTMLGQNQTTCNARIGSANYDYGHVFSTGGGGIASLGSVCSSNSKAQGVTGSPSPVGDPFDIDYVAHEMGHQFGGSHTFNSILGSCTGNRSTTSAYEIGSATTIQGYAGICSTDDIQSHSDDYYHIRSLEQMTGTSVMACATNVASDNGLPTLSPISKTYIIPYKTNFELTAVGTDPNNDPMTYCWEEWDYGGNGAAWDAVTTNAPILRSFNPSVSNTRVFPIWPKVVQNVESYKGEILPVNARTLKFRCTLRDMHLGYGAFYTSPDTLKLDVRTTPTLFRVNSQSANGTVWQGSSSQTITWDVAGTNGSPINCVNVNIYASTDSGHTFPHVLAVNVPNNGTANVFSPNISTTYARVKVKAADNVFFDLNDGWITINKVNYPAGINDITESQVTVYPNPTTGSFTIEAPANLKNAQLEIVNSIGEIILTSAFDEKYTAQISHVAKGVYFVKIKSDNNKQLVKKVIVQ